MPCPYVFSKWPTHVGIGPQLRPSVPVSIAGAATTTSCEPTVSFYEKGKFVGRPLEQLLNPRRRGMWIWILRPCCQHTIKLWRRFPIFGRSPQKGGDRRSHAPKSRNACARSDLLHRRWGSGRQPKPAFAESSKPVAASLSACKSVLGVSLLWFRSMIQKQRRRAPYPLTRKWRKSLPKLCGVGSRRKGGPFRQRRRSRATGSGASHEGYDAPRGESKRLLDYT